MSNVKLAIRVRPFTERELKSEKDRIPVVNVADEHTVTITNMKVSASGAGDSRERTRRYYADYTFDSSCHASHAAYASQEKVFESLGREVVASISRGSSVCVMAYGQSATGKTHTMTGSDSQPGLVPRLCRALAPLPLAQITVSLSMMCSSDFLKTEMVMMKLESAVEKRCTKLKYGRLRGNRFRYFSSIARAMITDELNDGFVRLKTKNIRDLRCVAVHDVETLLALVSEGTRRRHTAATRRNSTSSRSHALLEIATPNATLHLADLAGSEKASWEGCGGGRQKEGANINKSLVALSNVISALVSSGSGRSRFVPYRDSALTWLLKDCFTGGASTFIIATVSPSIACYGESASTLRWAERARQLPTPKNINLGSNITSKAVLQTQFNQLISELARNFITYIPETGKISYDGRHWKLQASKDSPNIAVISEAKIGSIMNKAHPKPDANNSESNASSVGSGSSDVINTIEKNIKIVDEINKEVDKLFVPTLNRTNSSTDFNIVAPLRNKRRQYRSQEVLQVDEALVSNPNNNSVSSLPSPKTNEHTDKGKVPNIAILHDSQRAEIVASVTERLYTKLKKKEEAAVSKAESVVDKKIMEPLSELRICTNARQRLMELSQKALRHKRRIGIPAYTQTRASVIRVKDQGVDVQTDLESYIVRNQNSKSYAYLRDVGTETMPMTPRCKEVAVGSKYSSLTFNDKSTSTETKKVVRKTSYMMTDNLVKCEKCTQTPVVPPPRRKKRALNMTKYLRNEDGHCPDENSASVISINILQTYPADSESQSSDENLQTTDTVLKPKIVLTTPDLLTNHCDVNTIENKEHNLCIEVSALQNNKGDTMTNSTDSLESTKQSEEFPDTDDYSLPRVSVDPVKKSNEDEIKNIILGRNENMYPYNIILSPPKERETKRIVTFKDIDVAHAINVASQTDWDTENTECAIKTKCESSTNFDVTAKDIDKAINETFSDTTDSSKLETDSFIWKKGNTASNISGCVRRSNYVPVYKSYPKSKAMRNKFYREFLGLDHDPNVNTHSLTENFGNNYSSSDSTEAYSTYKNRPRTISSEYLKRQHEKPKETFEDVDDEIDKSCNDLERSVKNYESYLNNYRINKRGEKKYTAVRTPSAHLQHLVRLRREVVKAEGEPTD